MKTLSVNLSQISKWTVDSDNVKFYDSIMKTKGKVSTLDVRGYIDYLCEFNIFYTVTE